jgi:cell division protein ZapA (FtsZ GTPase activity inhibitor)
MSGRITFEILNERFTIRSDVEEEYFLGIVEKLREKIADIQRRFPTLSNLKSTMLAAIDFLDELEKLQKRSLKQDDVALLENLSQSLASVIDEGEDGISPDWR